ncbi:MAG: DsbA family protein [Candidatus Dadabacteria bacterium]|nr:DsbA family protein [Candidatus Dadabacteria bacterium]
MKNLTIVTLVIALFSLALGFGAYRRISNIKDEISSMKESNQKMASTVEELKKDSQAFSTYQRPERTRIVAFDNQGEIKGNQNAPITLIEFCDYESFFCRKFHEDVMPNIQNNLIKDGKIRYVYMDFPKETHKNAIPVANAVRCAGDQGKFWEVFDLAYSSNDYLDVQKILGASKELGLNQGELEKCIKSNKYAPDIDGEIELGKKLGVNVVPSLYIGKTGDGSEIEVTYIIGSRDYLNIKNNIDKLINEPGK